MVIKTRNLLVLLIILSASMLPLYRQSTSDLAMAEKSAKYVEEKWKNDIWGILKEGVSSFKEKLFKEDQPVPKTKWDRTKEFLTYGFGYGFNSIGATVQIIHYSKISFYPQTGLIGSFLLLIILLEILFLIISRWRYLIGIMGLMGMLGALLLYGSTLESIHDTEVVLWGWVLFLVIQLFLMVAYRQKKSITDHAENTSDL